VNYEITICHYIHFHIRVNWIHQYKTQYCLCLELRFKSFASKQIVFFYIVFVLFYLALNWY